MQPIRHALLISPEFEGIKTSNGGQGVFNNALLISPEFEGIKTSTSALFFALVSLLISPEFEGIKTGHDSRVKIGQPATDQPRIRGD